MSANDGKGIGLFVGLGDGVGVGVAVGRTVSLEVAAGEAVADGKGDVAAGDEHALATIRTARISGRRIGP
jgi:hypothetical protein